MRRLAWLSSAAAVLVAALIASAVPRAQTSTDTYELDVVVTSRDEKPIMDLKQEDFQITDDGKKATVTSFTKVTLGGTPAPGDGRTVVIVLDDSASAKATESLQTLAVTMLQNSSPTGGDRISIMRLGSQSDPLAFDAATVRARLGSFQAGVMPYAAGQTPEEFLQLVTKIADQLTDPPSRRKAILCVGAPAVCSVAARASNATGPLWSNWVNTMTALGKTNTSVYAFMPVQNPVSDGALTDYSGGRSFTTAPDFTAFAKQVWTELSNYYVIGYKAEPSSKELRPISVKVSRGGSRVYVRKLRGK